MKKILKIATVVLFVALAIVQFIRPNFSNPPIVPGETLEDSTAVPAEVQMLMSRSCNDCHSNKTLYPWYSQISPFNWFLADHIEEGRNEMNFSVWNTYTPKKKLKKLDEIREQIETMEMPLPSYLWIHRDAKLSEEQSKLIRDWATEEAQKIKAANPDL
jgi:Haem-binding domain